ncbi:zf-HC2 domain-containing protein [Arthrobacter alpinus]|nr:zf-HC2 domain-containing protein [Arthrobacter alpinus]
METSDSYALWDAAYVLGSLPAAQRREFEQHLSTCSSCQRQVAALSGIPTLLARNGAENAEAFAVAPAVAGHVPLYAGLADQLARRRRRFTVALAAAAIIVAGTTAAITTGLNSSTAPRRPPSAVLPRVSR